MGIMVDDGVALVVGPHFVFASSSNVYGPETPPPEPRGERVL